MLSPVLLLPVAVVLGGAVLYLRYRLRCLQCGRWWGKMLISSNLIDEKDYVETITTQRFADHRSSRDVRSCRSTS